MALKHFAGSPHVIKLVSGLSHCASNETINRLETAFSIKQLQSGEKIPSGFLHHQIATMVVDNIDFGEKAHRCRNNPLYEWYNILGC